MTDYDSIYHRLFGHAGMVASLLREFVPEPWRDDFDLDAITRENAKFHADRGKRRYADTAWRIPRRDGSAAYVLVMLEFQSTIDRWMALRVLVYVGLLWQHLIDARRLPPDGRLPPILPIVLNNGERRWSAPISLHKLVGLPEGSPLWKWQPDTHYYIIDEGGYKLADLEKREGLLPLLFRLENATDIDHVASVTKALALWFKANRAPRRLRLLFWELLQSATAALAPEIPMPMPMPNNLLECETMLTERIETWKQKALLEGHQQGRQEGRQEGHQQGRQEGLRDGEAALLLRLLARRFGELPTWVAERVNAAETDTVEEWGLRLLEAGSIDEVFR